MKTKFLILVSLVLVGYSLSAQKNFSFLDCVTTSISGGYNFGARVDRGLSAELPTNFIYQGEDEGRSLHTLNYATYSFESTYYIKAYRNLRIGLGGEFTMRHSYADYVSTLAPEAQFPVIISKYDEKFHLFGPSIDIAYAIPKWKLRINYHHGYLFVKNRRPYIDTSEIQVLVNSDISTETYYVDTYKLEVDDIDKDFGNKLPVSAFVNGLDIRYRVAPRVYLMLKFRRIMDLFQFRVQYQRREESWSGGVKEYDVDDVAISSPRYQVGIGLSYHFFERNNAP